MFCVDIGVHWKLRSVGNHALKGGTSFFKSLPVVPTRHEDGVLEEIRCAANPCSLMISLSSRRHVF
jgi:hypothetical protein